MSIHAWAMWRPGGLSIHMCQCFKVCLHSSLSDQPSYLQPIHGDPLCSIVFRCSCSCLSIMEWQLLWRWNITGTTQLYQSYSLTLLTPHVNPVSAADQRGKWENMWCRLGKNCLHQRCFYVIQPKKLHPMLNQCGKLIGLAKSHQFKAIWYLFHPTF